MLDIPKLERRWLKYKIKYYLPYAVLGTIFILSSIGIAIYQDKPSETPQNVSTISMKAKQIPSPPQTIGNSTTMVLEPSMAFMESVTQYQNDTNDISLPSASPSVQHTPIKKAPALPKEIVLDNTTPPQPPMVQPVIVKPVASHEKNQAGLITREKSTLDIHELETRFKENSNPNLGLFIARYHYDHNNYQEAYNFALKTNSINKNMEESWLIFAKSLIKLGKTAEARKTLQLYISESNSENAKNLYNTLSKETK